MASKNGQHKTETAIIESVKEISIPNSKRKIYTWSSMLEVPKEPDWIIKDLVAAGSVVTLYGNGGSKKTYSAIDLGVCSMIKDNWLGFEIPKPIAVFYVDEESGKDRLGRRYNEIRNGYNIKKELPIYTMCMARYSLRDVDEINELKRAVKASGAKLLIIDSLVTVLQGEENSSKDMLQLYINLKNIAVELSMVVLIIHHANKVNGYRGSTVIRDQSNLLIHITSKSESPNIDFETEKENDIQHTKWSAVSYLDKATNKFYLLSSRNKQARLGKAQEHVIAYLYQYNRATMDDLKTNHGDCSSSAIRNAAYKLLDDKFITNDEFKGKARILQLTEIGRSYAEQYIGSSIENIINTSYLS